MIAVAIAVAAGSGTGFACVCVLLPGFRIRRLLLLLQLLLPGFCNPLPRVLVLILALVLP